MLSPLEELFPCCLGGLTQLLFLIIDVSQSPIWPLAKINQRLISDRYMTKGRLVSICP